MNIHHYKNKLKNITRQTKELNKTLKTFERHVANIKKQLDQLDKARVLNKEKIEIQRKRIVRSKRFTKKC